MFLPRVLSPRFASVCLMQGASSPAEGSHSAPGSPLSLPANSMPVSCSGEGNGVNKSCNEKSTGYLLLVRHFVAQDPDLRHLDFHHVAWLEPHRRIAMDAGPRR